MRKWLQLTRAHTAPLEIIPAVLGALLVTGGRITDAVIMWGIFGLLYHLTGYGHNSISDYRSGHDKDDPNKEHHPLNRNGVQFVIGSIVVISLLFITTILFGLYLVWPSIEAISLIVIMVAAGLAYNIYGKETKWKFVLISLAHSTVFALPYISMGGDIMAPVFLYMWVYVFMWVVYQIAISGEIKDVATDEENLLKDLGMETIGHVRSNKVTLKIPHRIPLLGVAIRSLMIISAIGVGVVTGGSGTIIAAVIIWLSMFISSDMLSSGEYNRDYRLKLMSVIEASSLAGFCLMMTFSIGYKLSLALVAGSAIWLVVLNKVEWGTWLAPKV